LSVRGIECSGVVFSLRVRPRRVSARQPTYFLTSESRQRPPLRGGNPKPLRFSTPPTGDSRAPARFASCWRWRTLPAAMCSRGVVRGGWVARADRVDGSPIAPDGPVHRASPRRCRFSPDSNGRTPGSTAVAAR